MQETAQDDGPGEVASSSPTPTNRRDRRRPRRTRRLGVLGLGAVVVLLAAACKPGVTNLDGVPTSDRLVFSRIGTTLATPANTTVHDIATVRITNNDADKPFTITGATVTGPWVLNNPAQLPAVLPGSGSIDIAVKFVAIGGGRVKTGSVVFATDHAESPTITVSLAGHWQSVLEGAEPTLPNLVNDIFGYQTVIVNSGQTLDNRGHLEAVGQEVLSPYWARTDATKPVTVKQLAAYHVQGTFSFFSWAEVGSTTSNLVSVHAQSAAQSILPVDGNGNLNGGSFSPPGIFHLRLDGEDSVREYNDTTNDHARGCVDPCGHHVRFWPLTDGTGAVVPDTWLVAYDLNSVNSDYNDGLYLLTNLHPATP